MSRGTIGPALAATLLVLSAVDVRDPASAHSYRLGRIAIGHMWAPPPAAGTAATAVYGPILNRGEAQVRLFSASTDIAESVRFRVEKAGEVRWPDAITLRPGRPVTLAPWREHIWLTGLERPLAAGSSFDLTLDFGQAGSLTVKVVVERSAGH